MINTHAIVMIVLKNNKFVKMYFYRIDNDYAFVCFGKKSFTPDALPAATLPIYPGLGPASRDTEICLRWL